MNMFSERSDVVSSFREPRTVAGGTAAASGRRPTIRDIAREAGVSVGTVSRVLSGAENVDPDIRRRTSEVLDARQYLRHKAAGLQRVRSRHGVRTGNIGVLFHTISMRWQDSQVYTELMHGIEEACAAKGYHPVVETASHRPVSDLPRCVLEGKVDGLLVKALGIDRAFVDSVGCVCPLVILNEYYPLLPVDQVVADDAGGAECVVEYLAGLGHRRIAFANMQRSHPKFLARSEGYVRAMRARGLYDPALLVERDLIGQGFRFDQGAVPSMEPLVDAVLALDPRPSAVIFPNDWAACMAYDWLKKRGVRIGVDLAVVGFDDTLPVCEVMDPPLTSFAVPFREVGGLAARVLMERIEAPRAGGAVKPRIQVVPGELKPRASVMRVGEAKVGNRGG